MQIAPSNDTEIGLIISSQSEVIRLSVSPENSSKNFLIFLDVKNLSKIAFLFPLNKSFLCVRVACINVIKELKPQIQIQLPIKCVPTEQIDFYL